MAAGFLFLGIFLGIFTGSHYVDRILTKFGLGFRIADLGFPYRLGLDIQGGAHLIYRADLSHISTSEWSDSMEALRDVIERRVNLFGVSEPIVQVERSRDEWRLIVELAGVRDVGLAIQMIGATPFLEFREERPEKEREEILDRLRKGSTDATEDPYFQPTPLTGRYLKKAVLNFDQTTFKPQIGLELNEEGAKIFAELTKKNLGKQLAIYLDGAPISAPVVREEISGGKAEISGNFTPQSAKELVGRLNAGALPVPIELVAQQSVEASLGKASLDKSLYAGLLGFLAVAIFMIFWYRLPGFMAVTSLLLYVGIVLAIFKMLPVTLTVAGIAGFVLSVGMAVDANVLIFERMKEELRAGKSLEEAIKQGFGRAWTSIRDSNVSSLITSAILYWLGTSVVKGFALTLGIGILVSMFSAISVTRTLLITVMTERLKSLRVLFLSGINR